MNDYILKSINDWIIIMAKTHGCCQRVRRTFLSCDRSVFEDSPTLNQCLDRWYWGWWGSGSRWWRWRGGWWWWWWRWWHHHRHDDGGTGRGGVLVCAVRENVHDAARSWSSHEEKPQRGEAFRLRALQQDFWTRDQPQPTQVKKNFHHLFHHCIPSWLPLVSFSEIVFLLLN